jgi:hypothetical protein
MVKPDSTLLTRGHPAPVPHAPPLHRLGPLAALLAACWSCGLDAQTNPPQDQWDQVRSYYTNLGIPQPFVDAWRPFTTPRAERVAGLSVLPPVPLNPLPGIHLDPDLAALGMVSVLDFGADPAGVRDSTAAIQQAVDFGRDHALVTFFPPGTYTVSGTIKAWSLTRVGPDYENGKINREDYLVPVLVGSAAGTQRPVIRLAPGTFPQYTPTERRFVVEFRNFAPPPTSASASFVDENGVTRFHYELVPHRLTPTDRERLRENTPDHIGPEFRGIDIEIAADNAGASGLRFPTAETSGIGDLEIRFLAEGHVGLQGPPGGGSASVNITIVGGRIGLDTTGQSFQTNNFPGDSTGTQPTPVLTGLRLINQTELAVRSQVRGTLVGVGWHIETQLNGPVIMLRHAWYGDPFSSSLALIDSSIVYHTAQPFGNVVVGRHGDAEDRNRSFYFDNVYIRNAEAVYRADNLPATTFATNPVGWFHVKRLGYERRPRPRDGYTLFERVWLDGQLHGTWLFRGYALAAAAQPPADLLTRHIYHPPFPHFEVPGAVNIRSFGAVGDALADDTAAIRAAIAAAAANGSNVVIVPRGHFKVSDTIDLLPHTKLIGVNRQWSVITSSQADGVFGGAAHRTDYPQGIPMIRTADSATADTVIAHLRLAVGYPIKTHNGWWTSGGFPNFTQPGAIPYPESLVEVYPLQWRSGGSSVVREALFNPRNEFNFHFNLYNELSYSGAIFLHPLIRIEGNGGGRWYGFHFHGYFPFGPDGELIRISNNLNPIHFYHLHAQHNTARNLIKLDNARLVSIYGVKTEHHKTLLTSNHSDHLRIFGHGGIATPAPGGQHYWFDNTPNFLIGAIGDEIRFGANASTGSGWSIMYFTNFENYRLFVDRQGSTDQFPPFNERPIVYQRGNPQAGSPVGPLVMHNLQFQASANGSLSGVLNQQVASGASSGSVLAVPDAGYSFSGWTGDYSGTRNPLYLNDVRQAMSITAHFQLASTPPVVAILYPTQGTTLYVGETVSLLGSALDAADGDLSQTAAWSSNRDGVLGNGATLMLSSLSAGLHQLTLSATNSAQQTATATAIVWVQSGAIVVPATQGLAPGNNTPWLATRVRIPDLGYSGLVRGAGLAGRSGNDVFQVLHSAPGEGANLAHSLANNQFIGFTLTPAPGTSLNLDGARLSFSVSRQNSTAASHFAVFSSVDGFAEGHQLAIGVHSAAPAEFVTLSFTLSGSRFTALTTPIEFRIYPHNASWSRTLSFRDFALVRDVPVAPQPSLFEQWATQQGLTGGPLAVSGGITHLMRYALGGSANSTADALLPQFVATHSADGLSFAVTLHRIADPALRYALWFSPNLTDWGHSPVWSALGGNPSTINIQVPSATRGFMRLSISQE